MAEAVSTQQHSRIVAELHRVCKATGVRPLLAVEAGSRAWGFESSDSDYDIRFVYARPALDYLRMARPRDVIEPRDLSALALDPAFDISGWDLPKALDLARRSNPALLEWLYGPITYFQDEAFASELRRIMADFSPADLMRHYMSMGRRQYQAYIKNGGEKVVYKKYLYALRPVFCVLWMRRRPGSLPPVAFVDLWRDVEGDDPDVARLRPFIGDLLARKARTTEKDALPRCTEIEGFIEANMRSTAVDAGEAVPGRHPDVAALNELCRRILMAG